MRSVIVMVAALALCACDGASKPAGEKGAPAAKSGVALPTGPVLSGVGVLAAMEGRSVALDIESVTGGLPAGRHSFIADAAVLAEAPGEPGARVAFSYQDWTPQPLLVELKPR